jgi:hypothetical protein
MTRGEVGQRGLARTHFQRSEKTEIRQVSFEPLFAQFEARLFSGFWRFLIRPRKKHCDNRADSKNQAASRQNFPGPKHFFESLRFFLTTENAASFGEFLLSRNIAPRISTHPTAVRFANFGQSGVGWFDKNAKIHAG